MRHGTKIALGIVGGLVMLSIIGCLIIVAVLSTAGRALVGVIGTSAERVPAVAASIAEFDVPEGYVADYAADFAGFAIAAYKPREGRGHILLAQAPDWVEIDENQIAAEMRRAAGKTTEVTRTRVEEVREVVVRGEPVTMTISRGESAAGHAYVEGVTVFKGKGGTACLVVVGEAETWNQAEVDALIASME